MFDSKSRYANLETTHLHVTREDGTVDRIAYKRRRFIPPAGTTTLAEHSVVQGDRVDNVTARYIGDPEEFWRVCDANTVIRPSSLTERPGRRIRIGLSEL
jgi:hypothetical protein